jgi:hypothetical protein
MSDPKSETSKERKPQEEQMPDGEFGRRSLVADFWEYLMENKKWWLLPIIIGIAGLILLVAVSAPALLPFIYTIF